jgi:alpha-L-rhamnosidase
VVVHSDLRRTGWFECSDERLNRLHEAAVWSFRDNACDIPTDCPHRERYGWTGDWQVFAPTAAFLYDVAGFSAKWLRDLAADQRSDGAVAHGVPDTMPAEVSKNEVPIGSAGWGDAAVIVPWEMYCAYGDTRLLEDQWNSMASWVEYALRCARQGRHPNRAALRPEASEYEAYIWDTGFHWGEWAEPGDDVSDIFAQKRDEGVVATAYMHLSCRLLADIASLLNRGAAAARYRELATSTKLAWQHEFIGADGLLIPDTQATYTRALAFDLVPNDARPRMADRLVQLIRGAGNHLGTGFLATPFLLPVLADTGYPDVAFTLLLQNTEPSWLNMIDRGATTIWEYWDGIGRDGVVHRSLNHYTKGVVISFLHRYVAGIRPGSGEPAYRRFRVEPLIGGGIRSASAILDSPYGRIATSWRLEANTFVLDVLVPPGTCAEVRLPNGERFEHTPGTARYQATLVRPDRSAI